MTRGTDANLAIVFTTPPRTADPRPRTRSAPGLDRHDRIQRQRDGYPPEPCEPETRLADPREPIAVLADVLGRVGAEQSATAIRQQNLSDADHLAVLHAIWTAETKNARHDRYRDLVTAALPPGHRQPLSHQARWLFRALHAAELAGLDPADVLTTAITARDLAGARDIAAVLDARIRPRIYPLLPQPQGPWTERVPSLPDQDHHAYMAQIAALMDDRTRRLGQHTAQHPSRWAVAALGPVPDVPVDRRVWEHKASSIAAYREMYGYDHPNDPIGPEPSRQSPDQRVAWHQAFTTLNPVDGPDVRAMTNGRLWLLRDTYSAETAWAPRHVGKELRLARLGSANADLNAIRAAAEADTARKTGHHDRARRHETLGASYQAMRDHHQRQETVFAQTMDDRRDWEHATAGTRRLVIAADAELRRRHPTLKIEPLHSAEPAPVSDTNRDPLTLAPGQEIGEIATWVRDLAEQRQAFREKLEERQRLTESSQDRNWDNADKPFPRWGALSRDAILWPPKPQIAPSARILQLATEHDVAPEAAD